MVNILILILLVAVIAFGMGVWSLIIVSRRSPKIYEIEPKVGAICADLSSLIRNSKKLFYLTSEVTQGILQGTDDSPIDSPKLVEAFIIDKNQEINKNEKVNKDSKEVNDLIDSKDRQELNQEDLNSKNWFGISFWDRLTRNKGNEINEKIDKENEEEIAAKEEVL